MKELSIVIPTYKRSSSVKRLLQSIDQQNYDFNQLEVLVISNFGDQELENIINSMGLENFEATLLVANKPGANASRNLGIKKSIGRYIYLLDDDCCLRESISLTKLVNLHQDNKEIEVIGGSYEVSRDATVEERAYYLISKEWQYIYGLGDSTSTRLVGGNVSYKKDLFKQCGEFFDESIHYGGSEAEFHKRLFKKNVKMIYVPHLTVMHESKIDQNDIVNKARKQALTHSQFDIDSGGYIDQKKTYQDNLSVWALGISKNGNEYRKIIKLVELYNWVYHSVLDQPKISALMLRWKMVRWMNKGRALIGKS